MVSFGSKALPRRRKEYITADCCLISGEDGLYTQERKRSKMGRKSDKKRGSSDGSHQPEGASGGASDGTVKDKKSTKNLNSSEPETSFIRKQVDPEMAKYFADIANLLDGGNVDLEERSVICSNALDESRGKEFELATDHIISHTMQVLLEGCDVDHLCGFLRGCANNFVHIATDRCGSHVLETALKCLVSHIQDEDIHSSMKDTLTALCQAVVCKPVDIMCNCHGSHVLRSVLCLCKGVALDSEFHSAKSSTVLARRLNLNADKKSKSDLPNSYPGFPELLEFLVSEIVKCGKTNIATLQADQYSSLVLQTALKMMEGQHQELIQIIPIIMGCEMGNTEEGNLIENTEAQNIKEKVKENAFSHLMEVILEVAPDVLYDEIFVKIFQGSLFDISCHQSANFVAQALISHARNESQIGAIIEELGPKFKDLLENGKPGVVASLTAASERLHAYEHKCSKALASAVTSANESPKCIVPRILLLESYFYSRDRSNWSWDSSCRVHFMGSLILQSLFKYPCEYIDPFITSITSMDDSHVLETAKDTAGARVLESFLSSGASDKQKKKLISKLKGHFGELALHPSGSFTVEKCFNATGVPLREAIVTDLAAVQKELSKTRQGPLLLRNLDVDGFSRRPEQWRTRQKSKLTMYKDFLAEFGSAETDTTKRKNAPADISKKAAQQTNIKKMRTEIDSVLTSITSSDGSKKHKKRSEGSKNQVDETAERKSDKKKRKHSDKDDSSKSQKKLKA